MELNDLERVDKNHMFKEYDRWPEIAVESFERKFQKLDVKAVSYTHLTLPTILLV